MGRRKVTYKPSAWAKRQQRDAEAFNLVAKILADGCRKKSSAVREAATKLGRGDRSVWTSLKRHEQALKDSARADREWDLDHGAEPSAEECKELADRYYEIMMDRLR